MIFLTILDFVACGDFFCNPPQNYQVDWYNLFNFFSDLLCRQHIRISQRSLNKCNVTRDEPLNMVRGTRNTALNGFIQSWFTTSYKNLLVLTIPLEDFESLKLDTPANHMINDHLISGKLFLTQKRLVFKSFENEEYYWLWRTCSLSNFTRQCLIWVENLLLRIIVKTD